MRLYIQYYIPIYVVNINNVVDKHSPTMFCVYVGNR